MRHRETRAPARSDRERAQNTGGELNKFLIVKMVTVWHDRLFRRKRAGRRAERLGRFPRPGPSRSVMLRVGLSPVASGEACRPFVRHDVAAEKPREIEVPVLESGRRELLPELLPIAADRSSSQPSEASGECRS